MFLYYMFVYVSILCHLVLMEISVDLLMNRVNLPYHTLNTIQSNGSVSRPIEADRLLADR